jgi:hypothetical protein
MVFLKTWTANSIFSLKPTRRTWIPRLLIHPTLLPDFEDFNDLAIIAESAVEEHGLEGILQVASFHPKFQFADTDPEDIGNYTNRAPFPTLHLIREESLRGRWRRFRTPKTSLNAISKRCRNWGWPAGEHWDCHSLWKNEPRGVSARRHPD